MTSPVFAWTKPFYGVTHCGKVGHGQWWVSVTDYGSFADLECWFPGCGFSPLETQHGSAEAAKAAGETWLRQNDRNLAKSADSQ
ncbi:hypothetical protein GFK26_18350 [Variovorax paradoxus]|uniref:Uncharacterized protein n=1 Tax=Variovorax paradoxus TaxID=34073 RepID=A0A5Q0M4C1_VARPD|nr:hypothetical protein [Variovorax paradoxus]QFZ84590.1 hypothetical protein GFK26_18350 [Variovorax paradoxus]